MTVLHNLTYELSNEFLESSITPFTVIIIVGYLLFVYVIGPRFMKNRPPYQLKHFMAIYNIMQVLFCLYIIDRVWKLTSWSIFNFTKYVNYEPNTHAHQYYENIALKVYLLKTFELTDTIIFVLRKKQTQITFLHVFHHSAVLTLIWIIMKYYKGNGVLFSIYLNSWIHVIMYSYYFLANVCSAETMQKFIKIKKFITVLQMIQFCFILIQIGFACVYCEVHAFFKFYYGLIISVIFYSFYDFYKKTYLQTQAKKLTNKTK